MRSQLFRNLPAGIALLLTTTLAFSAIPDRVNHEKFNLLWQAQKTVSDNARKNSNDRFNEYNLKKSKRLELEQEKRRALDSIAALANNIKATEREISDLNASIASWRSQIGSRQQEIQGLETTISRLTAELSAKQSEVRNQKEVIRQIESDRNTAQSALNIARTQLQTAQANLENSIRIRDQAQESLEQLIRSLDSLIAELAAVVAEKDANQSAINDLTQQNETLAREISALEQKKTETEVAQLGLVAQLKDQKQLIQSINQQINQQQKQLDEINRKIANATTNHHLQDWSSYYRRSFHATIELSYTKWPSADKLPAAWNENKESVLKYLEQGLHGIHLEVVDESGDPVEGVSVAVSSATRSITYQTAFINRATLPGTQTVRLSKPGYQELSVNLPVNYFTGDFTRIVLKR